MEQIATREILWNIDSFANVVLMYGLFALSMLVMATGLYRHALLVTGGADSPENTGNGLKGFFKLLTMGLFQRGVIRRRDIGIAHTLIYFGFFVLLFTTTMVLIDHDLGIRIYRGDFYLAVTLLSDVFGLGVIIGCVLAAKRRYIDQADLVHNQPADAYLLGMLVLLCVQGFLLEGLRIHATQDPWAAYSPVGNLVASLIWGLSDFSTRLLHFSIWWLHTITVFVFIALLPYTKLFHVVASAANLYFQPRKRPKGRIKSPGDLEALIEKGEEFSIGLGTIKDYSWKQLLDLEACTSCGRCQDACPAYTTGKPLSPKWMVLDTRNHALSLHADGKLREDTLTPAPLQKLDSILTKRYLEKSCGVLPAEGEDSSSYRGTGSFRANNEQVQNSVLSLGEDPDDFISGKVLDKNVFWSCTTCMACVEACPVGINHVDMIVENRQNMVLMQGDVPSEAGATLKALETRTNPYGAPEDRVKWLEDLDVRILKPGDETDYLYWVGCVSSYDPRKQKIARALVTLMKEAGLSFGILGTAEGCTGDPARRLGEENLFQTLAKSNIQTLCSVKFKTLVANCPHCFNTIKNEYPEFGNLGEGQSPEIIHHSQLLKRLTRENKIELKPGKQESVTFHDPCYLGRYNDEYDAPRETLRKNSSLNIIEMDKSKEKGLCCGAGGGHFWMDLKIGERVNSVRVDQAAATGANKVATACPFCMQMLEDGVKLTGREGELEVKDIAEFMVENLKNN